MLRALSQQLSRRWSFAWGTGWSGSGGGISADETRPSYQPSTYSNGATTGTSTMCMAPDVAYNAVNYAIYDTSGAGGWLDVGGTSAAAPQWAALVAIADQGRALDGAGTLGGGTQTLPALYQLPSSDFHDITSGSNGGYSAGAGYDLVTGLGTTDSATRRTATWPRRRSPVQVEIWPLPSWPVRPVWDQRFYPNSRPATAMSSSLSVRLGPICNLRVRCSSRSGAWANMIRAILFSGSITEAEA